MHFVTDGASTDMHGAGPSSEPPAEVVLTPKPGRGGPKGPSKKKKLGVGAVAWTHAAVSAVQVFGCCSHCPASPCSCSTCELYLEMQGSPHRFFFGGAALLLSCECLYWPLHIKTGCKSRVPVSS